MKYNLSHARRLIAMWNAGSTISDHSWCEGSGMLSDFYLPRWEKFFSADETALASGKDPDPKTFTQSLLQRELVYSE